METENMETENTNVCYELSEISDTQKTAIKNMGVYALPDSPAAYGMKAGAVKPKFWQPLIDGENSLVGLINAMIRTLNTILGDVQGKQEKSVTKVVFEETTCEMVASFGFREGEENDTEPARIPLGNSIKKIEYSSSEGLVDTYTITCFSGETFTFDVRNGANGADAVAPQVRISATNKWEVSTDGGDSWESLGVNATGNQFVTFYKDYGTIEEMNAAVEAQIDDGVPVNGLVMIQKDDTIVDEGDATGRVYRKTLNADGTYFYKYMADLTGLVGPSGADADNDAIASMLKKYIDESFLKGAW